MPLKSKAQSRWWFANDPKKAKEMVKDTPGGVEGLPERVRKVRKQIRKQRFKSKWDL